MMAASAASLIGAVSASHAGHAGFHHRRGLMGTGYEEVCSTYTTTWCGEGTRMLPNSELAFEQGMSTHGTLN